MTNVDILDIESIMLDNVSLKKILEDGIVTEKEVMEQSEKSLQ